VAAMGATVGTLILGLFSMFSHENGAELRSNKMMRLRILFQTLSILIFSVLLFSHKL
jgi:hypothetical protein